MFEIEFAKLSIAGRIRLTNEFGTGLKINPSLSLYGEIKGAVGAQGRKQGWNFLGITAIGLTSLLRVNRTHLRWYQQRASGTGWKRKGGKHAVIGTSIAVGYAIPA